MEHRRNRKGERLREHTAMASPTLQGVADES
jgi:hypothetical protein